MREFVNGLSRRSFLQVAAVAGCSRGLAQERKADSTEPNESFPKGLRRLSVGYPVEDFAISPDGKLLATCGAGPQMVSADTDQGRRITLWDLALLRPVRVLDGSRDCLSVSFSPDGALVAGGRRQRGARVWEVKSGQEMATLHERPGDHGQFPRAENNIRSIQFTWDSKKLIYGAYQRARVWDLANERLLWRIDDTAGRAILVALKPKSNQLASAGHDEGILLFDFEHGHFIREVEFEIRTEVKGAAKWVEQIAYSPAGDFLGCLDMNGTFWLLNTKDYAREASWKYENCRSFAFSPDGKMVALGGPRVRLLDLKTRLVVSELLGNMNSRQRVAFSPDGQVLVTTAPNLLVNVWEMGAVLSIGKMN